MANYIKRGESIYIPFRNGLSIADSQLKPRMYKTRTGFEKCFPGHYLGKDGVELVEYAEVVHGQWERECVPIANMDIVRYRDTCSICGNKADFLWRDSRYNYCPNCGASMTEGDPK